MVAEISATLAPSARGAQRSVETRGAGADHRELGLDRGGGWHSRVPYSDGDARLLQPSGLSRATTPGCTPSVPQRIVAIERHLDESGWFGFERREAPRGRPRRCSSSATTRGYVAALERLCAAGGGQIDDDTLVSAGSWEAALRAAGGAVAVVDVLLSRRGGGGVLGRAPARPSRAARARDGLLPVQQRRARGDCTRSTAHGLERVLILDWDVHHGNGTNDLFHDSAQVLYVVDPRVAAVSREAARRAIAAAATARASR